MPLLSSSKKPQKVVILGGGVIGLTAALVLAHKGYAVTVVARDIPDGTPASLQSQSYASPWAGSNWHPFPAPASAPGVELVRNWERATFPRLKALIGTGLAETLPWIDYALGEDNYDETVTKAWYNDLVPDHRILRREEVPKEYKAGATLTILSIAPATYLPWLYQQLLGLGVRIVRRKVESLEEAAAIEEGTHCVVNATGLGAASLIGCMDDAVMPIRGQTVLVRAPWVKTGLSVDGFEDGTFIYIIPRPDGNVVLGGTMDLNSWDTSVDPSTARRILQNAYKHCPALSKGQGWEAIDVISHNVGLRPARKGGPRMELERVALPLGKGEAKWMRPTWPPLKEGEKERMIGVVHAYGIGPAGYQSSWGMAEHVSRLVDEHFASITSETRPSKL